MILKSAVVQQSGVIPYRIRADQIEVLLITSARRKRWIIPKGLIEPFMTPADSAAKEAQEEAGVIGTVFTPAIGCYEARKWGLRAQVHVFLMQVDVELEAWDEAHLRDRQWLSLEKAVRRIEIEALKPLLKTLAAQISAVGVR